MKTIKIKSVSEYIQFIENRKYVSPRLKSIYRGQNNDLKLLPKIFRVPYLRGKSLIYIENLLLEEFKIKSKVYLEREQISDLEYLAIAQHHGLITRLLDWSENSLTALWFCVENKTEEKNDGVVWILENYEFMRNYVNSEDFKNPFSIDSIKIFKPPYISNRIFAQSSIFTIHPYNTKTEKAIEVEENTYNDFELQKIIIPYDSFDDIKKTLIKCGIHSASLFPDLNGICCFLNSIPSDYKSFQIMLDFAKSVYKSNEQN